MGENQPDGIITCYLTPFHEAFMQALNTNLFGENINKGDLINIMNEESFIIKTRKIQFDELDRCIAEMPNTAKDDKAKIYHLILYRIAIALKLHIEPKNIHFVGVADMNKPLPTDDVDNEERRVFFVMHPAEVRNYNAKITLDFKTIIYKGTGTVNEANVPQYVLVFSAPDPSDILDYKIGNYPCYVF